ncbi:MAG: peptidylprolyl isomerase [Thermoanaerobaculia bacterium]
MRRRAVAILILLALFGCKRKPVTPPDVIVRVGERTLTLDDFKAYIERNAGTELAQVAPEVASAMLDQYVEEVVVSEYAATHGVEVPAEKIASAVRTQAGATVIEKRDEMRRELLVARIAQEAPDATLEQARAYYDQRQDEFKSGDEVRVRQILVRERALAETIVQQLSAGTPFEELSVRHSIAPNAKRGGEIGFIARGDLPKLFEDEIFHLQPGEVSDIIETESSYHLFKVEERRTPGTIDFQTALPVVRERLREQAIRDRLAQIVAVSRKEMVIAILTRRLPFRYSGTLPRVTDE